MSIINRRAVDVTPLEPDWLLFKGCRVRKSSGTQSLTGGAPGTVTFDVEDFDTDTFHSTVSESDKITIPAQYDNAYVVLTAGVLMSTPSTGFSIIQIRRTRSAVEVPLVGTVLPAAGSGSDYYNVTTGPILVEEGDFYQVTYATENNGLITNDPRTFFSLTVLGF